MAVLFKKTRENDVGRAVIRWQKAKQEDSVVARQREDDYTSNATAP
jgi:hypothetical protein